MFNRFIWENYTESNAGKLAIQRFEQLDSTIYSEYLSEYFLNTDEIAGIVDDLLENSGIVADNGSDVISAKQLFDSLISDGLTLYGNDGEILEHYPPDFRWYNDFIVPISTWLHCIKPDQFIPFFFIHNFSAFNLIADTFGINLPSVPPKSNHLARFEYYWSACEVLADFARLHQLKPAEMCAFLYDFCSKFLNQTAMALTDHLPEPTQVWLVGANKGDFEFIDKPAADDHFWQGNLDTKRGDIIVLYCLSPRSHIHSIWRATADGVASPFFHWYSSIRIGYAQAVTPISLNQLKADTYFTNHKLVKKNFQGVNGYPLSAADYQRLLQIMTQNGDEIDLLPQLYAPDYIGNQTLQTERDVETALIEPLLMDIDSSLQWVRQLTVKMGRGEKVFPDYALLTTDQKGYEQASILLEAKYHIKNNAELEQAFRQVWSYGLRLSASLLIIADKNVIWLYEKSGQGFDRQHYTKIFWKELQNPDTFAKIQHIVVKCKP